MTAWLLDISTCCATLISVGLCAKSRSIWTVVERSKGVWDRGCEAEEIVPVESLWAWAWLEAVSCDSPERFRLRTFRVLRAEVESLVDDGIEEDGPEGLFDDKLRELPAES